MRPRMSRIFWRGKLPRLPAQGHRRHQEARPDRARALRPVLPVGRGQAQGQARTTSSSGSPTASASACTRHFFKSYTEKVWGVPTTELRAEWAAQRIKGLSFFSAAKAAFFGNKGNKIKSLIDKFQYPRYGPGQMWEMMTDAHRGDGRRGAAGDARPRRSSVEDGRVVAHPHADERHRAARHRSRRCRCAHTVGITDPAAPAEVQQAAQGLRYRDFLTVALVLDGEDLFPDNWIYIHEPDVRVGRIQNYRSWTPVDGPRPRHRLRRPGVLRLQGRRPLDDGRRRPRRAGHARARAARPRRARAGPPRLRRARPARLPDVRRDLRRARRDDPRAGSTRSRTSSRSAATACTATTTPTTRCSVGDARGRQRPAQRAATTSGRSTSSRPTTRSRPTPTPSSPTRRVPRPPAQPSPGRAMARAACAA